VRFRSTTGAVLVVAFLALSGSVGLYAPTGSRRSTTLIYGLTSEPDTLKPAHHTAYRQFRYYLPASLIRSSTRTLMANLQPALALSIHITAMASPGPPSAPWRHLGRRAAFTSADVAFTYKTLFDKKNNVFKYHGLGPR